MRKSLLIFLSVVIAVLSFPFVSFAQDDVPYISEQAAAEAVRDGMIQREPYVWVRIKYDGDDGLAEVCQRIFGKAVSEDISVGSSAGDYLNDSYKSYGWCEDIHDGVVCVRFRFFYYTTADEERYVDNYVDSMCSQLGLYSGTDYERVKKIYKFVCSHVSYGSTYGDKCYTAWAAVKGNAVCQGYSLLFYKMCRESGIAVRCIKGGGHEWNIVRVNGCWYNVDATWDAGLSEKDWVYFLKCNANFRNHSANDESRRIMQALNMAQDDYMAPVTTTKPAVKTTVKQTEKATTVAVEHKTTTASTVTAAETTTQQTADTVISESSAAKSVSTTSSVCPNDAPADTNMVASGNHSNPIVLIWVIAGIVITGLVAVYFKCRKLK